MNTDKELKPCPFCGSEAEKPDIEVSGMCAVHWWINCSQCGCILDLYESKAEVIEAWNTRTKEEDGE